MTTTAKHRRSTSELIRDLSDQSTRLMRQEVELARAELTQKVVEAGRGLGLFAGAAILGLYGLGAVTAAGILLLSTTMRAWVAAAVIAAGFLALAGGAALTAKTLLARAAPAVPEATIETTKQDVETIRTSIREGRS